jgi:phosphomannomutase
LKTQVWYWLTPKELNIVLPLCTVLIKLVPDTLSQAGYSQVHIVEEQRVPNGDFPTVKSPNPEEPEALTMALALADKKMQILW